MERTPEGLMVKLPCPFCSAPDWKTYTWQNTAQAVTEEATCSHCNRTAKYEVVTRMGQRILELVQTDGPPQPEWLIPKARVLKDSGA